MTTPARIRQFARDKFAEAFCDAPDLGPMLTAMGNYCPPLLGLLPTLEALDTMGPRERRQALRKALTNLTTSIKSQREFPFTLRYSYGS